MRADRHVALAERMDHFARPARAFELDHRGAALAHQASRGRERGRRVARAQERHVGDQQRAVHAARGARGVIDHLIDRDRQRARMTLHDHAERIADQHDVDAGGIGRRGEARVVRGDRDDLLAAPLALAKLGTFNGGPAGDCGGMRHLRRKERLFRADVPRLKARAFRAAVRNREYRRDRATPRCGRGPARATRGRYRPAAAARTRARRGAGAARRSPGSSMRMSPNSRISRSSTRGPQRVPSRWRPCARSIASSASSSARGESRVASDRGRIDEGRLIGTTPGRRAEQARGAQEPAFRQVRQIASIALRTCRSGSSRLLPMPM